MIAAISGTGLVAANVLPTFLAASLVTQIGQDLRFGAAELGFCLALFYIFCAAASTAAGRVVDRIGGTQAARTSAMVIATSSFLIATAVSSSAGLITLLVISGAGNSLGTPAASAILRHSIPPSRQGLAFGLLQSGAPIGALLAGAALPVIAIPLGWRTAYGIAAGMALVIAMALPRIPSRRHAAPRLRRTVSDGGQVYVLSAAAALASAASMGLAAFIVSYSVAEGMSEAAAGTLLASFSFCALAARVALGHAADRRTIKPLRFVGFMLAASSAGYLLLIAGTADAILAGVFFVGVMGWSWPGVLTVAVIERSPGAPVWSVGLMMSGLFAGAAAGPLAIGVLASQEAFGLAWVTCAISAFAASALVLAVHRRKAKTEA